MRCSKCGCENPTGKRFCSDCGAPLTSGCPKCCAKNPPDKRFCGDCGATLLAGNPPAQSPASLSGRGIQIEAEQGASDLADGERKTVTALFADIKRSISGRKGPRGKSEAKLAM